MRYRCIQVLSDQLWFTKDKEYAGEVVIPPIVPNENWLFIYKSDDGKPAYANAVQFTQLYTQGEGKNV